MFTVSVVRLTAEQRRLGVINFLFLGNGCVPNPLRNFYLFVYNGNFYTYACGRVLVDGTVVYGRDYFKGTGPNQRFNRMMVVSSTCVGLVLVLGFPSRANRPIKVYFIASVMVVTRGLSVFVMGVSGRFFRRICSGWVGVISPVDNYLFRVYLVKFLIAVRQGLVCVRGVCFASRSFRHLSLKRSTGPISHVRKVDQTFKGGWGSFRLCLSVMFL